MKRGAGVDIWRRRTLSIAAAVALLTCVEGRAAESDEAIVAQAMQQVEVLFELKDGALDDAGLLADGRALAQAHLARVRGLLPGWLAEARARTAQGAPADEAERRFLARVLNELALWGLDSGGPAHDAAQLRALQRPGFCREFDDLSDFGLTLRLWQALPAPERAEGLAGERARLARWGQPRPGVPGEGPWPQPEQRLRALVAEAQAAAGSFEPVMSPVLAAGLLHEADWFPGARDRWRCETFRWLLVTNLTRQPEAAAEALQVFRHAMRRVPALPAAPAGATQDYPRVARMFGVEGTVTVEWGVASGRQPEPRIRRRQLSVPGLEGTRPAAFESVLDEASLARARAAPLPAGQAGTPRVVDFVWKLQ